MTADEVYDAERKALREELHNLKSCQITFLTSSVTATGVLLGLATTLARTPILGFVFLFPLVVLLPFWWIFFDKATTITRIVGYYRILESLILRRCEVGNFVGWENALGEFRERQDQGKLSLPEKVQKHPWPHDLGKMLLLRTAHPYWLISNYIFFALSTLCVLTSAVILWGVWQYLVLILIPGVLVAISIWRNLRTVWQLIQGRNSYDCNEEFWKQILEVHRVA